MSTADGDITIIFNGEIYNFKELAKEYNLKLRTKSDTEILLELYIQFGPSILNELNGMFALVILNKETSELFIARDRLGIKPLYYTNHKGFITFSSEIAPLISLYGFSEIDEITLGFQRSDLIVIAGRPSMGKTALALNIAENVARQTDRTVLIFSMEMSAEQVVRRFISSIANIDLQRLMRGQLQDNDWEGIDKALSVLSNKKILLDDTPALSPTELRARSRRVKRENKDLAMIVVDYIGLMQIPGKSENRVTEISEISRSLKALAKELDVPVVALSQLNRAVESRPNKRPILSDLRDSGAIEQDADVIAFLYRHEYYDRSDLENKGKAEINIAKQRNGPTRTTSLAFRDSVARFENLAKDERYPTQYYEDGEGD